MIVLATDYPGTIKEGKMDKHKLVKKYCEYFEYYGSTAIKRIKKRGRKIISREWILFDSIEEAREFFNEYCHA
jgi:hypothetical protein